MSDHQFRNIDGRETDSVRELIRWLCPGGKDGLVVEDLDLVLRYYGPRYNLDATGVFALVEVKHADHTTLQTAQERSFGLIDSICSESPRFLGSYVAAWHGESPLLASWKVRRLVGGRDCWKGDGSQFAQDLVANNGWQRLVPALRVAS